MHRRELLRGGVKAALLLCLPALDLRGFELQAEPALPEFSDQLRRLASVVADALIPRTDTPGAVDIGTVAFAEHLLRHTDAASFDAFVAGAAAFAAEAAHELGSPFSTATSRFQQRYVQRADQICFSGAAQAGTSAAFFLTLKRLTVIGYYTSQAGAHAELDVQPYPGPFRGTVPLVTQPKTYYEDSFGVPRERPPGYLGR